MERCVLSRKRRLAAGDFLIGQGLPFMGYCGKTRSYDGEQDPSADQA